MAYPSFFSSGAAAFRAFAAAALLLLMPGLAQAQPVFSAQLLPHGTLLSTALPSAPFPSVSRKGGHYYRDVRYPAGQHYQDSTVLIFIPQHLEPGREVNCIVHFHGWWNHTDSVLQAFKLTEQLSGSGAAAILIVPQGPRNAPDSGGGKMEEAGQFGRLLQDVLAVVAEHWQEESVRPGRVVLSGHSGGYRAMAYILLHGGWPIEEVWLFDGLYGQLEKYAMWLERGGQRMVNLYTDDGGTYDTSQGFLKSLRAWGIQAHEVGSGETGALPNLPRAGAVFWHTELGHNDVLHVKRQFEHLCRYSPALSR